MKKILMPFIAVIMISLIMININSVFGVNMPTNPGYDASNLTNDAVKTKVNTVMGTFVFVVQVACVATMIIMGLRYMLSSADGKADIKKGLVVWCVGAVLVFGATTLIGLVLEVVTNKEFVSVTPNEKSEEQIQKENEKEVSDWAAGYWEKAKEAGLIPSSINNKPKAKISRIEFTESIYILAEKYGMSLTMPGNGLGISDDGLSSSEKNKILKLYNAGIVSGTGKDTNGNIVFNADADITRQDVATIIYRLLSKSGKLKNTTVTEADKNNVVYSEVSSYAKEAMVYMHKNEIIVGDEKGNLNPMGNTTCEQAVTILYRIFSGEK